MYIFFLNMTYFKTQKFGSLLNVKIIMLIKFLVYTFKSIPPSFLIDPDNEKIEVKGFTPVI